MKALWIAILLVIVVGGIFMWSSPSEAPSPADTNQDEGIAVGEPNPSAPGVRELAVTGANFSFSPNQLKVKKGETVRITFSNAEGFHDFVIDEFKVATKQIKANESETVEFVADKAGTFEYYCSVGAHRKNGMVGKLVVEE